MFYCDKCAIERGYPKSFISKSFGQCEICGKESVCNDFPSKLLPETNVKNKENNAINFLCLIFFEVFYILLWFGFVYLIYLLYN